MMVNGIRRRTQDICRFIIVVIFVILLYGCASLSLCSVRPCMVFFVSNPHLSIIIKPFSRVQQVTL
jgi:hypothetical protein